MVTFSESVAAQLIIIIIGVGGKISRGDRDTKVQLEAACQLVQRLSFAS